MQMINLCNQSKQKVVVKVNGTCVGTIATGKSFCFNVDAAQTTQLTLCHEKDSFKKSGNAHMNIETTYELSEPAENMEFVITSEHMYVDMGIHYNCFYLSKRGKIVEPMQYCVQGLENLKKSFANQGIKERLIDALLDLLLELIMAPIATIIGVVIIVLCLGWKWLLIIFFGLYLLSLMGELFGEWFGKLFTKLIDKEYVNESMEQKIERCSRTEYIEDYYRDPDGSRHMGK